MSKTISFRLRGSFDNTDRFLSRLKRGTPEDILRKYGERGVAALKSATPTDTGLTASSWYYEIVRNSRGLKLEFKNSNIQNEYAQIAILLQYGHATRNGGWVEGRDYINPALRPLFDQMADDAWKEVVGR